MFIKNRKGELTLQMIILTLAITAIAVAIALRLLDANTTGSDAVVNSLDNIPIMPHVSP